MGNGALVKVEHVSGVFSNMNKNYQPHQLNNERWAFQLEQPETTGDVFVNSLFKPKFMCFFCMDLKGCMAALINRSLNPEEYERVVGIMKIWS